MDNEEFKLIYNKALDLISRREHSKYELFLKVQRKFPDRTNVIDNALTKLEEHGLINDRRFAEMYVMHRANKGFGPKKIEMELQNKKISSLIISEIINDFEGWNEAIKKSYKKKFGEKNLSEVGAILKAKRFLYQRGFNELQIQSVLGDA